MTTNMIIFVAVVATLACMVSVLGVLLMIHVKLGHKVPNATKIELKRKKQELKATYVSARKALKDANKESGKK